MEQLNAPALRAFRRWLPDFFGGTTAMLVALPSAIAFGIVIYSAIGTHYTATGAMAGILGTITLGLAAAAFGATRRLITAPCAPAAAILVVFVQEQLASGTPADRIPLLLLLVGAMAGLLQLIAAALKGGRFIKYLPYPVVAGYLSGVGILIFMAQFPRLTGMSTGVSFLHSMTRVDQWVWHSIAVGIVTIAVMLTAPRVTKRVPAAVLALVSGVATYFGCAIVEPELLHLSANPFVIGPILTEDFVLSNAVMQRVAAARELSFSIVVSLLAPAATLALLLSIDTLKTCLVLNALTRSRSDANGELRGQGIGNLVSALCGGMPGAGTMGPTLVNATSGGTTRASGFIEGAAALFVLLILGHAIAWIPVSALAGILIVVALRMMDRRVLALLRRRSTLLDFAVILGVIVAAVTLSLIWAAGVGIAFSVLLFLRDQILQPVVRRQLSGSEVHSRRRRLPRAMRFLQQQGHRNVLFELQGQLFFGTTDQLLNEVEPAIEKTRNILLDMRHVRAVDYSAAYVLHQIEARIQDGGGRLLFAALPADGQREGGIRKYLEDLGFVSSGDVSCFFDSVDEALEWAEDDLLREAGALDTDGDDARTLALFEHPFFARVSREALADLEQIVTRESVAPGDAIFRCGDRGATLHFIAKGTVKVLLPIDGGVPHHVATFSRGDFFGDIAFLDREPRSADAVAQDEVVLFALDRDDFDTLCQSHAKTTAIVFEQLSRMLALRLRQTNREVEALARA